MVAVGAMVAREPGVVVAAVEEGGDGPACAVLGTADRGGGFGSQAGAWRSRGRHGGRVIVEHLPDGRGAGLAGAVADAGSFRCGRS